MIALVSLLSFRVRSRASLEFELIAPRHQLIGFRIYWRQQARNLVADMRVSPRDYKLDHIVPLDLWGRPACLMLQPWAGACNAHMKDDLERQLSIMVCAGDLTLKGAQHEIATDWRAGYKKWINGKGCGEQ